VTFLLSITRAQAVRHLSRQRQLRNQQVFLNWLKGSFVWICTDTMQHISWVLAARSFMGELCRRCGRSARKILRRPQLNRSRALASLTLTLTRGRQKSYDYARQRAHAPLMQCRLIRPASTAAAGRSFAPAPRSEE